MHAPRKYRVKRYAKGTGDLLPPQDDDQIVYQLLYHDYGLAAQDSRATHIPHISVTLDPAGDYPSFTIPVRMLEELPKE